MEYVIRPEQKVNARHYDVVVAGGGTGGVFAAIAAARAGAKTALIESKGYVGGIAVEGGCGLHSFYNLWKAFPGTEKRMVVRGIPEEFIQRLYQAGGCTGHIESPMYYEYDSDTLCVDVEIYKFLALHMLREEGVHVMLNTMVADALKDNDRITGVITESHEGAEAVMGKVFIDATGYGDLSARAGASFTTPNDYRVTNSMGVGGIDIDKYYEFFRANNALRECARGPRSGKLNQLVRVSGHWNKICPELEKSMNDLNIVSTATTLHDNYFMYLKVSFKTEVSPVNRDALADAEYQIRRRQMEAIELYRKTIPGAENCFIARTSPTLTIRRGRCIECEYDISNDEIVNATHYPDEVYSYGFHDSAPRIQIKNGRTFGLPYRAMVVKNIANLFAIGMLITSEKEAHMSTRNTVSCMAMGQAAGTAAGLCVQSGYSGIRDLPYAQLYRALKIGNVWFDAEVPYREN